MKLTRIMRDSRPHRRKSEGLKILEQMANQEAIRTHPNVNPIYLAPRLYTDSTANALTKAVIDFLNLSGHQAERISTTGRVIDKRQRFEDVTGKVREIGSVTWIPTSGTRGAADISAVVNGRAVKIEVKMRDQQSEAQKIYQQRIEQAGGIYLLVHSFDEFFSWYQTEATA